MNQTLNDIVSAIPPPSEPQDVPHDWARVEDALGMMLPRDYREFISLYGTGQFEPLEVRAWNLSVTKPEPDVGWLLDQHEFCHDAQDRSRPTLLEYAKQTPLYPWGKARHWNYSSGRWRGRLRNGMSSFPPMATANTIAIPTTAPRTYLPTYSWLGIQAS